MEPTKSVQNRAGTKVVALAVSALVQTGMCGLSRAVVLPLSGDASQTTPEYNRSAADALLSTLNDPFAYDPASPTSPLPFQTINTNADALKGYNGQEVPPITVAYTFGGASDGLFFDLYGRDNCCFERDNDLTMELFNGDWTTPVSTTTGFAVSDSAPYAGRFTPSSSIVADRIRITGPAFFTLMEIRGNGNTAVGASTWAPNASGDWNDPTKWINGVPNSVGAQAVLGSAIGSPQTIFTNSSITLGSLQFDNINSYQVTGQGSLTLNVSTGSALVDVAQGSHKINLPLTFAADTSVTVAEGAALTIADPATIQANKTVTKSGNLLIQAPLTIEAGGALVLASGPTTAFGAPSLGTGAKIDVKTNSMTVDYRGQASPAGTVKDQLTSGYAAGAWNGEGINTSSAIANQTALGWKDDAASQSILVKYTYYGDANLDGQVDISDLGALATAWQTSAVWSQGDFDYSGFVDISDLGKLATNWQLGVGNPLGPSFDEALASVGLAGVSVPEPGSISLVSLGMIALVSRRRRA